MTPGEWRALGLFGAAMLGLSLIDARYAYWMIGATAAIVLIAHSGQLLGAAQGRPLGPAGGGSGSGTGVGAGG